jgi:hypothetical protein
MIVGIINMLYGSAALAITAIAYENNGPILAAIAGAVFLACGMLGLWIQRHP